MTTPPHEITAIPAGDDSETVREAEALSAPSVGARNRSTSNRVEPLREKPVSKDALMTPILVPDEDGDAHEIPKRYSTADIFAIFIAVILAVPLLVIYILGVPAFVLPLGLIQAYRLFLPTPLDRVERTIGFHLLTFTFVVLGIPLLGLSLVALLLTWSISLIFSLPVGLVNWSRTRHSFCSLWPFRRTAGFYTSREVDARSPADNLAKKFGYLWPVSDIVAACIGGLDRQGFCEFLFAVPAMISICPLMKHAILNNPFLFRLDRLYINQWTKQLDPDEDGVSLFDLDDRQIFKDTIQQQFSQILGPLRWTLVSHTTHPYNVEGHAPRSRLAAWGLICVHLLWWNPWYVISGYVEVNVRRDSGLEHPMWLIADHTSKLAAQVLVGINLLFVEVGNSYADYLRGHPDLIRSSHASRPAP